MSDQERAVGSLRDLFQTVPQPRGKKQKKRRRRKLSNRLWSTSMTWKFWMKLSKVSSDIIKDTEGKFQRTLSSAATNCYLLDG